MRKDIDEWRKRYVEGDDNVSFASLAAIPGAPGIATLKTKAKKDRPTWVEQRMAYRESQKIGIPEIVGDREKIAALRAAQQDLANLLPERTIAKPRADSHRIEPRQDSKMPISFSEVSSQIVPSDIIEQHMRMANRMLAICHEKLESMSPDELTAKTFKEWFKLAVETQRLCLGLETGRSTVTVENLKTYTDAELEAIASGQYPA